MLLFQALTKCWNVFAILHPSLCVANITHSYFSRRFRIALTPNWKSGHWIITLPEEKNRIITDGSGLPERVSHVVCKFMRTPLLAPLLTKIVTKPNVINKFLQISVTGHQIVQGTFPFHKCHHKTNIHFSRYESHLKVETLFVLHVLCLACR